MYNTIYIVVDRFLKIARYIPTIKKLGAIELVELFITNIIALFSISIGIVTDRGSVFTSKF